MTEQVQIKAQADNRKRNLILGIIFDLVGYASYGVPLVAEITDVIWAPIAGFILSRMYKGAVGRVGGVLEFVEELIPGTDFIPTFTLTWIYTYLIKKEK
ncbi:hypothetical protein FLJC2902T_17950 [Flavobacterium limnosediminis JC2902]|uniref:Uncharacterized protein n=1 Tax=Flavobacterium limnosediminis JC2902 TaxID=1341181 RepID=V6SPQ1_9FLAO|nr:hypothetical protein [Flavobacterium limnosediminis]ESU28434.1 hypothetical protein FLJC2902T_17950 [Flavobacterium limnosediminis JC2902]